MTKLIDTSIAHWIKILCEERVSIIRCHVFCHPMSFCHPLVPGGLAPPSPPNRGLRPQALDTFGLNHPCKLVIGYHWLSFLNQVRKTLCPNFLRILVQHRPFLWKIKIGKLSFYKFFHCVSFWQKHGPFSSFMVRFWYRILSTKANIPQNKKNRIIISSTLRISSNFATFEGMRRRGEGGVCMSLTGTGPITLINCLMLRNWN